MNESSVPCSVIERWINAMNAHDLEMAADCFHTDYHDEASARLGEHIDGREQVRDNFSRLFQDCPT
jgi:SnoaL-like protein